MRIGMMTDMYKPYVSGVITYINQIKVQLEKKGHEVYVFTFGDEDYPDDEKNIIRSPGVPVLKKEVYLNVMHNRRARQLIRTLDVTHVHHPVFSGTFTIRFCQPRCIPIVFTHHTRYDVYVNTFLPSFVGFLGKSAFNYYMPDFLKKVDAIVVPSRGLEEIIENYGEIGPVYYEPHGMDLDPFLKVDPWNDSSQRNRSLPGITYSPEEFVFVYVGRLGPEKNLPLLLRSFQKVYQIHPQSRLMIVGDGPERDNLEDRIQLMGLSGVVHFCGMIPFNDLPSYYACGDVFVTPSISETFGLTVVEAMASGLPSIGIASPGISDHIQPGVTGLIAENTISDYSEQMSVLLTNPELRANLAKQSRQVSKHYTIDNTIDRLVEIYHESIDHCKTNRKCSRWIFLGDIMDEWLTRISRTT